MVKADGGFVLRALRSASADAEASDRELLGRYAGGDQVAFAALVSRHGGMVLGVCRRVVPTAQDAEDACQAVFLVLARKAAGGRWRTSIANWLYATARHVAATARRAAARRARHESRVVRPAAGSVLDQLSGREAFALLDEELDRLPARYREPLVLCYLEGLTRDEAAGRLGVPLATLKSQLDRGRRRLGDALSRRGVTLGASLIAAAGTAAAVAVPPRLTDTILTTVSGPPPAAVVALAKGVAMSTTIRQVKFAITAAAVLMGVGFGALRVPTAAAPQKPAAEKAEKPVPAADTKPAEKKVVLKGRIQSADGKPVAADLRLVRIDVRAAQVDGRVEPLGKAAVDGTFEVSVVPAGPAALLVAHADGHGTAFAVAKFDAAVDGVRFDQPPARKELTDEKGRKQDVVVPQEGTAAATLTLPKPHPIRGRVLDAEGKPVVGVTVAVRRVVGFDNGSADRHLKDWAGQASARRGGPGGDRVFALPPLTATDSPFVLKTDADGRFESTAFGADTLVEFAVGGAGVSDQSAMVFNRAQFDPKPLNEGPPGPDAKLATRFGPGGRKLLLHGAEPTIVVEREKVLRGAVTDVKTGKPRAGVTVYFSLADQQPLYPNPQTAVTDKDGRYEIRGARKSKRYMVECPADVTAGYLPCQAFGDDTAGYEPVTVDLKCAKGVVVTGRMTEKATGKPLLGMVDVAVLANNPFFKTYPTSTRSAIPQRNRTDRDGRFRVVTLPGHTLLMASPQPGRATWGDGDAVDARHLYRPEAADPKFPDYFHTEHGGLGYYGTDGSYGIVQGCWCKVIDAKEADAEVSVEVELVASTRMAVRVVDADGKPLTGAHVAGTTHHPWYPAAHFPKADTVTVYNVDPKKGRALAVAHLARGEVGVATVKPDDKDPAVKLGPPGRLTGRLVDTAGKPLTGVSANLHYHAPEVANASRPLGGREKPTFGASRQVTTDAKGEFRFDLLFPGQEFRLVYWDGGKVIGPEYKDAAVRAVAKPGDTLKLDEQAFESDRSDGRKK